jgi:hypothetical protein
MICGVCVLFMKYNQDSPFAYIRWLGPAHGPILRFTAIACFVAGAVLVRCGLSTPDQSLNLYRSKAVAISSRKLSACFESISCLGADVGLRIDVERKGPPSKTTYMTSHGLFAVCSSRNCSNRRRSGNCDHQNALGDRSVAYPLRNRSIAASRGGDFEMVQLWVNLPAAHKAASYQHSGASPDGGFCGMMFHFEGWFGNRR